MIAGMSATYLLAGFAPGLFWLWWIRRKDDLEPEPRGLVLRVFTLGFVSALGVFLLRPTYGLWLEDLVGGEPRWLRESFDAFVITGAGEELAKVLAFAIGAFYHHELDEPLDGIVYGVAAALGFASFENIVFLARYEDLSVIFYRGFTSTLGHVAFTGSIGFFFGRAKFAGARGRRWSLMAIGLLVGITLHGAYDLFLFLPSLPDTAALLVVLPLCLVLIGLKIRWARGQSPHYHPTLSEEPPV